MVQYFLQYLAKMLQYFPKPYLRSDDVSHCRALGLLASVPLSRQEFKWTLDHRAAHREDTAQRPASFDLVLKFALPDPLQ